jgi:hypothetical protein
LQIDAVRTALLLCESWRGASGPNTFNPTQLATTNPALAIEAVTISGGPAAPTDFTLLGNYKITVDSVDYYYVVLSWKDVSPGLRALNVIVAWDPRGSGSDIYELTNKSFKLTTYVAN